MAAIWLLSAVCSSSCLCLGILWFLLVTDNLWHLCWIWSDKFFFNMQMTVCSFKAKRGPIRSSLEKALKGWQAHKLFEGRMWLGEAITMICDTGLINDPPWRSVILSSHVMLVCGGVTSGCLVVAGILTLVHHKCQARRFHLTVKTLLIVAPLSAAVGLLQYAGVSSEMRTDARAEFGNGFDLACVLAVLTLVPGFVNRVLKQKMSLTPTEADVEEIQLQSVRRYGPQQHMMVDQARGRVPTMDPRGHLPGVSPAAGADWQQPDRHAPSIAAVGTMPPQWPDPYAGGDCGPSRGPSHSLHPLRSTCAALEVGGHMPSMYDVRQWAPSMIPGAYGQARSMAAPWMWRA